MVEDHRARLAASFAWWESLSSDERQLVVRAAIRGRALDADDPALAVVQRCAVESNRAKQGGWGAGPNQYALPAQLVAFLWDVEVQVRHSRLRPGV